MREAELDVRPQLFEMLVRVARHEPAPMSLAFDLSREPFHLARVIHAGLDVGGQREGGPDLGVIHRASAVGVIRDLDFDHPVQLASVASFGHGAFRERGQQLLRIELHTLT